jgi:hypothetical protein
MFKLMKVHVMFRALLHLLVECIKIRHKPGAFQLCVVHFDYQFLFALNDIDSKTHLEQLQAMQRMVESFGVQFTCVDLSDFVYEQLQQQSTEKCAEKSNQQRLIEWFSSVSSIEDKQELFMSLLGKCSAQWAKLNGYVFSFFSLLILFSSIFRRFIQSIDLMYAVVLE